MQLTTNTVDQTIQLGKLIGQLAPPNTCLALHGQLGAGKTHLTRGIALGANINDPNLICSPTYVLLNIYPGPKPVFHMDAYRIASEDDFEVVGLSELLTQNGLTVIEWPEKIPHLLPDDTLHIHIAPGNEDSSRTFRFEPTGPLAKSLTEKILASPQG